MPISAFTKSVSEAIGTFVLVFSGCGAVAANQLTGGALGHCGIALTFGLAVGVMIYAVGHLSGAHFNPAVTIALWVAGKFPLKHVPVYIGAQCLAAIAASVLLRLLLGPIAAGMHEAAELDIGVTQPIQGLAATAFIFEVALTFTLMFVIMAVGTDDRAQGQFGGVAVGATVALCALFGGPISGASMNPARSLGPAAAMMMWDHFPIYVVGPLVGAVASALVYARVCGQTQPRGAVLQTPDVGARQPASAGSSGQSGAVGSD